jgi:hypothetical protein
MSCARKGAAGRLLLGVALLLMLAAGCDAVGPCHPVSGKVRIHGKPVRGKAGVVLLKPDASKGNASPFDAWGAIDGEGNYTITTRRKAGAPPGWYKVVVTVAEPATGDSFDTPLIKRDYQSDKTTPLRLEVVPSPAAGAYDLNLKRK